MSASTIEVTLVFLAVLPIGGAICGIADLAAGIIDRMVAACAAMTKLRSSALSGDRQQFTMGYWVEEYAMWGMANVR